MSGDGRIPAENVEDMIQTLEKLHANPEILADIEKAIASCKKWASNLESLFAKDSLQILFVRDEPEEKVPEQVFIKIKEDLRKDKAIFAHIQLPGGIDHVFTVVGDRGENARVLHAWDNQYDKRSKPIEEMVALLEKLVEHDYMRSKNLNFSEILGDRARLQGSDHGGSACTTTKRISFNMITSAKLNKPLIECQNTLRTLSLELSDWHPASSVQSSVSKADALAIFRAALGFVLAAGGVLIEHTDLTEVLKKGVGYGIGKGIGFAVARGVAPGIARVGVSVVRANAAAGVAMFAVFTIWDVAKWAKHDITAVQLRQRLAKGAAGAAGGIAGGAAAGAAAGFFLGPIGALVGGGIGGFVGGIVGTVVGKALDKAIWDEGEDSVMNSYDFFGWHKVKRHQRPPKTAKEITAAYTGMLAKKPSESLEDKDWATVCTAHLMVLLRAMYPELKTILKISEDLRNKSSKAVSIIGSTIYSSTLAFDD